MFDNIIAAVLSAFVVASPVSDVDCKPKWEGNKLYKYCVGVGGGGNEKFPTKGPSRKAQPAPTPDPDPVPGDDGNNGHGNDPDRDDDSNPGKGKGKGRS